MGTENRRIVTNSTILLYSARTSTSLTCCPSTVISPEQARAANEQLGTIVRYFARMQERLLANGYTDLDQFYKDVSHARDVAEKLAMLFHHLSCQHGPKPPDNTMVG